MKSFEQQPRFAALPRTKSTEKIRSTTVEIYGDSKNIQDNMLKKDLSQASLNTTGEGFYQDGVYQKMNYSNQFGTLEKQRLKTSQLGSRPKIGHSKSTVNVNIYNTPKQQKNVVSLSKRKIIPTYQVTQSGWVTAGSESRKPTADTTRDFDTIDDVYQLTATKRT